MDVFCKSSCNEIEEMCKDVIILVKNTSTKEIKHQNDLIDQLRRICGKAECSCDSFPPSQNLSSLLSVLRSPNTLTDFTIGLSIISNYSSLAFMEHCQKALEHILKYSLNSSPSENRNNFLEKIWIHPGLRDFNIRTVEEFIYIESKFIEEDLYAAFEKLLKESIHPEVVWTGPLFERFVMWSCNSARIFCVVTSVLNTWLQRIVLINKHHQVLCLNVVAQFINGVKLKCAEIKRDFVLLYPFECHSLVTFLDINPEVFSENVGNGTSVTISTVLQLIEQNLKTKPAQTLCILTHFPDWVPLINLL